MVLFWVVLVLFCVCVCVCLHSQLLPYLPRQWPSLNYSEHFWLGENFWDLLCPAHLFFSFFFRQKVFKFPYSVAIFSNFSLDLNSIDLFSLGRKWRDDRFLSHFQHIGFWSLWLAFSSSSETILDGGEGFPIEHEIKTPSLVQAILGYSQYLSKHNTQPNIPH